MGPGAQILAAHIQNGGLHKHIGKMRYQMRALWEPLIFQKASLAPHLIILASREDVSNQRKMDLFI